MPDREKVINKVKLIVADMQEEVDEWKDYSDSELRGGLTCDCDWWYKTLQTLKDTIALLKAQEPRVMTLGDLRDIGSVWELNTPPYLWMEINPSYRWTRGFWVAWREIYDMIDGLHPTYDADNYGKMWRCWTSRPTDEQRKATSWQQ